MKIIDIRNTQSHGLVIDVQTSTLPYSIPVDEYIQGSGDLFVNMLIQFALTDPAHIAISQDTINQERDTMDKEWYDTYQSLM